MCSCANENIFFVTGLELPSKSQWQYISTSLKNETWIFFPAPPHPNQQIIIPNPGPTSAAGIRPLVSTIRLSSNTGIPERRVYAPGKGEGRREELARDRVLRRHRRRSLLNACAASVGKEDPGPTLIPLSVQYFLCHSISGEFAVCPFPKYHITLELIWVCSQVSPSATALVMVHLW